MNEYLKWLEIINKLLTIVGDVSLADAKTWVEVKANAEALREEGHENNPTEELPEG